MAYVKFGRNYSDTSTDSGFQFEFYCDRCNSGYQTPFEPFNNTVSSLLVMAGNIFGGVVGNLADASQHRRSVQWEQAHDQAFRNAVGTVQQTFDQCRQCGAWVDKACMNQAGTLCKDCHTEQAQAREAEAPAARPAKAKRSKSQLTCPACNSTVKSTHKFCPDCGSGL